MHLPNTSDLIFSEQANNNLSKTLGELKRSAFSIRNRLQSIDHDAAFVQEVSDAYHRPLIANERCGSWYIDTESKGGSAYFKSTDGHTGVWKFSSRRLNLHLLEIIGKNDGCIIIDSTRRGKRMPDALSKTIPIWCSVINRFLFPNETQYHELYTPPQVVSASEHEQISALLPSFLVVLKELKISVASLRQHISKPLRPIWVTPTSHLEPTSTIFEDFHPLICCTVSRRVSGGELSGEGYIQGAGDDTENWAHGLTPPLFWANKALLLSTPEEELPSLIEMLVRREANDDPEGRNALKQVGPTTYLFITLLPGIRARDADADECTIFLQPRITPEDTWQISPTHLDIGLGPHKIGSRNLREVLPFITSFVEKTLYPSSTSSPDIKTKSIILACETGKDHSIGVALALVCLFFDDRGELLKDPDPSKRPVIDKKFIKRRMSWFSTTMPEANPSRATLQSVNCFLMNRKDSSSSSPGGSRVHFDISLLSSPLPYGSSSSIEEED